MSKLEEIKNAMTNEDKPLLVVISSTWCGPCRQLKKFIEEDSSIRSSFTIVYLGIDEDMSVASEVMTWSAQEFRSVPVTMKYQKGTWTAHRGFTSSREFIDFLSK